MMSLRLELSKGAVLQATTLKAFVWRPRLTGVIDTPWVVTGTEPKRVYIAEAHRVSLLERRGQRSP